MKGSLSQVNIPNPAAFERANYIKTLTSFLGNAIWGLSDRDGGEGNSARGDTVPAAARANVPARRNRR